MKEEIRTVLRTLDALESADAHFHTCQSSQFRTFARSQLKAPALADALEKLRQCLEEKGKVEHGT